MTAENNRLREALGVTAWHNAGFTGKGVHAACGERFDGGSDSHGWKSKATFLELAPEATVHCLRWQGVVNDAFGCEVTAGIKTHGISVWWASLASAFTLPAVAEARFAAVTDCCVLLLAGGNKNSQNEGARVIESPSFWGVNACMCMADGRLLPAYYNFDSAHIDFCAPEGWTLPAGGRFTGTSAATPALAGLAALVQQLAIEQLGRPLAAGELHAFFADCARPVGSALQCGLGCPVLPPPETVELSRYLTRAPEPTRPQEQERHPIPTALSVVEHDWQWAHGLTARFSTDGVVLHHAAGTGAAEAIHAAHLRNGWAGIGYHYYICADGSVHRGRPEWACGAGVEGENGHLLHICFEGNFETDAMGPAQLAAGRLLLADVRTRWPLPVSRHSDWSRTACPGGRFPFDALTKQEGADKTMTGAEMYQAQSAYVSTLDESGWSRLEGGFAKATRQGVMDGTRPQAPVTREQLAAILLRLGLLD